MCLFCLCIGKVVLQDRRFLVDHFFPFRSLNISAHCLLASNVLLRNQLWILLGSPCMFSVIFLLFLKNYFLCLWVFLWICDLGVDLFVFGPTEVCWPYWFVGFHHIWYISAFFSLIFFFFFCYLLSFLPRGNSMTVHVLNGFPQFCEAVYFSLYLFLSVPWDV